MNPIRSVVLAVFAAAFVAAQEPAAIRDSFGVGMVGGVVSAGGPDYAARFDARGVEFLPRLARAGERAWPVRFTLESVRRGSSDAFERTPNVEPVVTGSRVGYSHRVDLTEVYDTRRDGIEQSFVFVTKPPGTGDLVVRGAITTELPLAAASDDGVRYEQPGVAGVTFGAVTGVDANGATARGSIRVDATGMHVEWVLPAAFVENAEYPMVLDPLIGSVITIGDLPGYTDVSPAVAFDDSTNRYLVVWQTPGAPGYDIYGQLVSAAGALLGAAFPIARGHLPDQAVVNVNGTNRFLVAYSTNWWSGPYMSTVKAVAVDAISGAVSNPVLVDFGGTGTSYRVDDPAIGGDSRALVTSDSVLFAYTRSTATASGSEVRTCIVHVPTTGDPFVSTSTFNTLAPGDSPRVTAQGGNPLRWLVTWTDHAISSAEKLHAAMLGTTGALCAPIVLLDLSAPGDLLLSPVSASRDGTTFLVAWHDQNGGNDRVRAKALTWSGNCGTGTLTQGPLLAPLTSLGRQFRPTVAFAKDKFVLAWTNEAAPGTPTQVFAKGLDPVTCASCGAEWTVENSVLDLKSPAVASRFDAGDTASDEALIVWSNGVIRGRRFEARSSDVVTAMGGGCSMSGFDDFATYSGDAVLGNADFQLAIANSVSLPLVLIVGFSNISAPCGSCTIVPSLDILLPPTNPYPLAIPCDATFVGVNLYTQWVLLKPSDCPVLPDFSFTTALRFTIGE